VVKVGGSLLRHPSKLKELCLRLGEAMEEAHLLTVPGGGRFADVVREVDVQLGLSPRAAHLMALKAMDVYGLLLADLIPRARVIEELAEAKQGSAIILPYYEASRDPEVPVGWEATGDAVAVRFAERLEVDRVIFIKDVDGLLDCEGRLVEEVKASDVKGWSCLDPVAPRIMERAGIQGLVVNGLHSERLLEALRGRRPLGTLIKPS